MEISRITISSSQAFESFSSWRPSPTSPTTCKSRQGLNDFLNPLPHQDMIFGQHNAIHNHFPWLLVGMEKVMVVPWPLRLGYLERAVGHEGPFIHRCQTQAFFGHFAGHGLL